MDTWAIWHRLVIWPKEKALTANMWIAWIAWILFSGKFEINIYISIYLHWTATSSTSSWCSLGTCFLFRRVSRAKRRPLERRERRSRRARCGSGEQRTTSKLGMKTIRLMSTLLIGQDTSGVHECP
ncbi:hypothetical protein M433DRAFT_198683 [Acidomyces richmondensis BFW]|nr:hypothetical protein M433DRAFT_198683 [Acidomyces richmondensis BFW]